MPGCFDALSAKLVADAGFKVTFMSGFAVSAAQLGLPDTGLISFSEMLDSVRNCCAAASKIPLIADGDTGYGNALNVQRTVIEYARAGAAAVMIEDQVSPKKCGHTRGKQVISREEARMKIRAAADVKTDNDILIMARTDARAVHGFDAALDRCRDFEDAGADIIFLEAPETEHEMRHFCGAMSKPCMANMVPGGKTPVLSPTELQEIGYKLALYPVMLLSASIGHRARISGHCAAQAGAPAASRKPAAPDRATRRTLRLSEMRWGVAPAGRRRHRSAGLRAGGVPRHSPRAFEAVVPGLRQHRASTGTQSAHSPWPGHAGFAGACAGGEICRSLPAVSSGGDLRARAGVELDRSTLADWVGQTARLVRPLVDAVGAHVMAAERVHADDTTVPVLEPGLGKTSTGRQVLCPR